jgi:uncharacterized protein (TIGR00251 family)
MLDLRQSGTDVLLAVSVQPRASRNAVIGLHGTALKLALTAPPIDGAANDACLRFLADLLGVSRARLSIVRGEKARQKLICIANASPERLRAHLQGLFPDLDP